MNVKVNSGEFHVPSKGSMLSDVTSLPLFQVAVSSPFNNKAGEGVFLHHLDDPKILGIQLEVILGTNSICFMVIDEKEAECGPLSVTYSDSVREIHTAKDDRVQFLALV